MSRATPRLASSPEHARASLLTFQAVMNSTDEPLKAMLIKIIPFVHSWVCIRDEATGEPLFGPSKFVGYRDMTVQSYRDHFKQMDGRDTERVMQGWLHLVDEEDELYNKLHEFCGRFGTKPRSSCRISTLGLETRDQPNEDQTALTELLVRVIQSLPPEQRDEISRRIGPR